VPRHLPGRTTHSLLLGKQAVLHPHVAHVQPLRVVGPAQRVGGRRVFLVVAEQAADGVADGHGRGGADDAVEDDQLRACGGHSWCFVRFGGRGEEGLRAGF
jgi:hypothetical protein